MSAIAASLLEVGQDFVINPTSGKRVTWTDNGDGTFTATFAGTTAVTNSVWWAWIDDQWEQASIWQAGGSRSGDGTVVVTVPQAGTFWAWAQSAEATPLQTPPVWFTVTDSTDSIWERLLDAVTAKVRSLGLTGLSSDEVHTMKVVSEEHVRECKAQTVLVAPLGPETALEGQGVVGRDDYEYPVLIAILHPANLDEETIGPYWKWRDRVKQSFQERQLPVTNAQVHRCQVTTDFEPTARVWWAFNVGASFIRLRFTVRETRE